MQGIPGLDNQPIAVAARRLPGNGIQRLRADDGIRTRDPHLGKVMLYQLSHVRTRTGSLLRA